MKRIKNAALFSRLQEAEQQRLARRSEPAGCGRDTSFYVAHEQSDRISLVTQGRVKLTRSSTEGRAVILGILAPREIFGKLSGTGEELRTRPTETEMTFPEVSGAMRRGRQDVGSH